MITDTEAGEVFSFVIQELVRLQRLGPDVLKDLRGLDFTCTIHDAEGHMRLIGRPAYERLRELTDRAVEQSVHRGRVDPQRAFACVRTGFGRDYIRPDFKGCPDAEDLQALQRWLDEAAADCRPLTHFVPCHIRLRAERFVVGPVLFAARETVIGEVEAKLAEWAAEGGRDREWREKDAERQLEYLRAFSDVARVRVERCDPQTSRRVADEAVQAALAFLHLMAGAERTSKVRAGGPAVRSAERSTLALDEEGDPFLTWIGDWEGARLDESFWRWMEANAQQAVTNAAGKAIASITDRTDPQMMAARYLDAAAWYADAATERRRPAAIIKYLTAMERLLWTGEKGGVTHRLASRAAALCFTIEPWNFEPLTEDIMRAYDLRSGIVHGRIREGDRAIARNYRLCERICRDLLLTWLSRYGDGFDRETTLDNLKAHLDGFVAEVTQETHARRKAQIKPAEQG